MFAKGLQIGEVRILNKNIIMDIWFNKKNKALLWWNKLTKSKQQEYEYKVFGCGEFWEDNSLHENDIIKIYNYYN